MYFCFGFLVGIVIMGILFRLAENQGGEKKK